MLQVWTSKHTVNPLPQPANASRASSSALLLETGFETSDQPLKRLAMSRSY